jgi:hypothetical protein
VANLDNLLDRPHLDPVFCEEHNNIIECHEHEGRPPLPIQPQGLRLSRMHAGHMPYYYYYYPRHVQMMERKANLFIRAPLLTWDLFGFTFFELNFLRNKIF